MSVRALPHQPARVSWSNRIVLLALVGIGYLTLFPFEFHAGAFRAAHDNPFLLGYSGKGSLFTKDFFLNVLLFVPLGFGIAAQVRKRGGGLLRALVWALLLGFFISYSVEFMQLYVPERDSGWEDVFSNATGSVVGALLFALLGGPLLEWLSRLENRVRAWFSPRRGACALLAYFAIAFGVSAWLQKQTRLSNWDPRCVLFLGNDASGHAPWTGQVFSLQIWNRALPEDAIRRLAVHDAFAPGDADPLASYEFGGPGPFRDRRNLLAPMGWTSERARPEGSGATEVGPKSWLSTKVSVEDLNRQIQRTSQFTVRVVCKSASVESGSGRIVSLSRSTENVNFHLRQAGTHLVFYFRNPLSETRSILAWDLPGIFVPGKTRDIVAEYDGSDAFLYVDGNSVPRKYRLGPGASLFHAIHFVRAPELEGCVVVYLTLLFLPAGALIGLTAGNWVRQRSSAAWLAVAGCILSAILLEVLLSAQSGRRIWPSNIALSVGFAFAGILLINSDSLQLGAPSTPDPKNENSSVPSES